MVSIDGNWHISRDYNLASNETSRNTEIQNSGSVESDGHMTSPRCQSLVLTDDQRRNSTGILKPRSRCSKADVACNARDRRKFHVTFEDEISEMFEKQIVMKVKISFNS